MKSDRNGRQPPDGRQSTPTPTSTPMQQQQRRSLFPFNYLNGLSAVIRHRHQSQPTTTTATATKKVTQRKDSQQERYNAKPNFINDHQDDDAENRANDSSVRQNHRQNNRLLFESSLQNYQQQQLATSNLTTTTKSQQHQFGVGLGVDGQSKNYTKDHMKNKRQQQQQQTMLPIMIDDDDDVSRNNDEIEAGVDGDELDGMRDEIELAGHDHRLVDGHDHHHRGADCDYAIGGQQQHHQHQQQQHQQRQHHSSLSQASSVYGFNGGDRAIGQRQFVIAGENAPTTAAANRAIAAQMRSQSSWQLSDRDRNQIYCTCPGSNTNPNSTATTTATNFALGGANNIIGGGQLHHHNINDQMMLMANPSAAGAALRQHQHHGLSLSTSNIASSQHQQQQLHLCNNNPNLDPNCIGGGGGDKPSEHQLFQRYSQSIANQNQLQHHTLHQPNLYDQISQRPIETLQTSTHRSLLHNNNNIPYNSQPLNYHNNDPNNNNHNYIQTTINSNNEQNHYQPANQIDVMILAARQAQEERRQIGHTNKLIIDSKKEEAKCSKKKDSKKASKKEETKKKSKSKNKKSKKLSQEAEDFVSLDEPSAGSCESDNFRLNNIDQQQQQIIDQTLFNNNHSQQYLPIRYNNNNTQVYHHHQQLLFNNNNNYTTQSQLYNQLQNYPSSQNSADYLNSSSADSRHQLIFEPPANQQQQHQSLFNNYSTKLAMLKQQAPQPPMRGSQLNLNQYSIQQSRLVQQPLHQSKSLMSIANDPTSNHHLIQAINSQMALGQGGALGGGHSTKSPFDHQHHVSATTGSANSDGGPTGSLPAAKLGCCASLARLLLFITNILFWSAGIALGGWGIWSLVEDNKYNLSQLLVFDSTASRMSLFQLLSWSFITLGCASILIGFCGCSAIFKNNRWILGLYIFLILAIFALDLATGLLAIIYQERLITNVRLKLGNKLRLDYGQSASFTAAIDYLQTKFHCCGLDGHFDYDQSSWRLQRLGGFETTVARTCCHLRNHEDDQAHINPLPLNETMCQSADVRFHQSYRYRRGCLDDLELLIRQKIWTFTMACVAVGAIVLVSLLFAICFCRSIPAPSNGKSSSSSAAEMVSSQKMRRQQQHQQQQRQLHSINRIASSANATSRHKQHQANSRAKMAHR